MRAMLMVMASILLAAGLFGCNEKTETAANVATAAAPPPAAALPPPPPPPPAKPARWLHHIHHARIHYASTRSAAPYMGHGSVSHVSYAESDQGYGDGSDGPYSDGPDGPDVYAEERGGGDGGGYDGPPPEPVWVDGHGRAHFDTPFDGGQPAEGPDDSRARRDPWHGWNSDCDRRGS